MTIFFSSDLHLFHENILKFESEVDGRPLRPEFKDVEEMNEAMVARHNSVVTYQDTWYCLGDLLFGIDRIDSVLSRMNGKKRLILGNHDYPKRKDFMRYFDHFQKVMESRRFGNLLFTHRPVLLGRQEHRILGNVHGHIHEKNIDDRRYLNVSVEQIDYTPVPLDWIVKTYKERGIDANVD